MPAFLELMRPRQWPKNLLVLAALLFSGRFSDPQALPPALSALAAFMLLSSAVYAFNDALDASSDRNHPRKKARPVASGSGGLPGPRWRRRSRKGWGPRTP